MKKILWSVFLLFVSTNMFVGNAMAAKPTSWDKVQTISIETVLDRQPDGTFTATVKTKAKALSTDGGVKVLKDKELLQGGASYTLQQVWNNWATLSILEKTEFKNIVKAAINEDVE